MNILFATDGSASAQAALGLIRRIQFPAGTTVTVLGVVHVVHPVVAEHDPLIGKRVRDLLAEVLAEERQHVGKLVQQAVADLQPAISGVRPLVREGDPAEQIIQAASELPGPAWERTAPGKADLLVLGSRGLGPLKSVFLGGVSRKVVRHAPCSILVVPPLAETSAGQPAQSTQPLRILLATDGSAPAERAAQLLYQLQLGPAAELLVVTVIPRYTPHTRLRPEIEEAERQAAEVLLARLQGQLVPRFGRVTTVVRGGDASQQILEQAAEFHADLVAVGSMGLTAVEAFFLGSVAEKVLRHAHRPVLVARGSVGPWD